MIHKVLFAALLLLPQCALAKIGGDLKRIPNEPKAHTIVAVPANYASNPAAQQVVAAFATNPKFLELRDASQVKAYAANDPDFRHRWAPRLPEVKQGQHVVLVEKGDRLIYGKAGGTADEIAAELTDRHIIEQIKAVNPSGEAANPSGEATCIKCMPFKRPHPKDEEPKDDVEDNKVLNPILPPPAPTPAPRFEPIEAAGIGAAAIALLTACPFGMVLITGLTYLFVRKIQERDDN